jgi:PAS domain S-box-containing protein
MRAVTGIERFFEAGELIVSKTDLTGRITYANDVFARISGYPVRSLLGQPHSIVRHPAMPRGVFALMWEALRAEAEFFGYVSNLTKSGDHYWVFAHITPSRDPQGRIVGYHSNRRTPNRAALPSVVALYRELLKEEARFGADRRAAVEASKALLQRKLSGGGQRYDEFVFELEGRRDAA